MIQLVMPSLFVYADFICLFIYFFLLKQEVCTVQFGNVNVKMCICVSEIYKADVGW